MILYKVNVDVESIFHELEYVHESYCKKTQFLFFRSFIDFLFCKFSKHLLITIKSNK